MAGGSPLGKALDGFDSYDDRVREEAHRQGVTTVCLTPDRGLEGACGVAQVIKLRPGVRKPDELTLVAEAAVCAGLGGIHEAPTVRARRYGTLDKQLRDARRYKASWLDYEESLEVDSTTGGTMAGAPKPPPGKPAAAGKGKGKEPKQPKQPKRVRLYELLARVLDHELPLRLEAQRAEDVASALELQASHGFELILEGGTEAYLLASSLASAKVDVILGEALGARPPGGEPLEFNRERRAPSRELGWARANPARWSLANARALSAAGVEPALGSGSWTRSRFVALNAALAVSGGLDPEVAEAGITRRAAEILGLGDRLGQVAPGFDADLIVTDALVDGEVHLTVVDGAVVYRKDG
jgi:hypothetical protein